MAGEFVDELKRKARIDIRYARGMECMQRERYIEYVNDLRAARERGDYARAREIIQDLGAFAHETVQLMHQRRGVYERCVAVGAAPAPPPCLARPGVSADRPLAPVIPFRPRSEVSDSGNAPPPPSSIE